MRGRGLIPSSVQRTSANWNSVAAKTITSVSWKLGDNLFFLSAFAFISWDSSFKDSNRICCGLVVFFELLDGVIVWLWMCICPIWPLTWVCVHWVFVRIQTSVPTFFHAGSQSAADSTLLSANTQMFCHCPFSRSSSGICKDKQRQQFTENNKPVICYSRKGVLVHSNFKAWDIYFYH